MHVTLDVVSVLPFRPQLQTYCCAELSGAMGNRRHDGRMSSGGDVPCVDVLRAALTVHLTATGI